MLRLRTADHIVLFITRPAAGQIATAIFKSTCIDIYPTDLSQSIPISSPKPAIPQPRTQALPLRPPGKHRIITQATYGSTSLSLGFVNSRRRFCVPKIAPTCFADDFDVYMACHPGLPLVGEFPNGRGIWLIVGCRRNLRGKQPICRGM